MSDPQPKPAGCWRLATLSCALAFVAGAVALLAKGGNGVVAPHELVDPAFEVGALPFGLELASATRLPFGFEIVHLRRPGAIAAENEALTEHAQVPAKSGDGESSKPKIQWRKLAIAPAGDEPWEAALLHFAGGDAAVRAWLDDGGGRSVSDLGDEGGLVAVDVGKFPWDAFEPHYAHRRKYEPPDKYADDVRVNLSANGRAWALAVIWPKGVTGSKEQAIAIARAFRPKPADEKEKPATAAH